jgi:methylenetetrahydrofolate dehydrogenase (NADP+)/methenyltetrahydrofolate cyclohydrolase
MIIDGKLVSTELKNTLKKQIETYKIKPKLVVIQVGNNEASNVYIKQKIKCADAIGAICVHEKLDENITTSELINLINSLNQDESVNGMIVQLPLPKHIDEYAVLNTIIPSKDVDGLTEINAGKLACSKPGLISCTPHGVIKLLKYYNIEIEGKKVVIVGRSNLVGKPLINLFLMENATVTCCHSKTVDLKHFTLDADILVVAVGKPKLINADMVKEGAVVIDVGINRLETGLCGDVDFENVSKKASYITPVPGGVGAMTVAMLYNNLVETTIKTLKKEKKI